MRIIHENYWKFFKDNVLQKQRDIRRLSLNEIKRIQWERLKTLLNYVYFGTAITISQSIGMLLIVAGIMIAVVFSQITVPRPQNEST